MKHETHMWLLQVGMTIQMVKCQSYGIVFIFIFFLTGAPSSMVPQPCMSICLTSQIWLNMTYHQWREVRRKRLYLFTHMYPPLAVFICSSAWWCSAGIMAGSPCPPELVRKVASVMGIKGITVSESWKNNFSITFLKEQHVSHKTALNQATWCNYQCYH